jgi:hypothetical protein
MINYYYFDQNNQKHGLISEEQLRELVSQGIITPHTSLETDGGHRGLAGQIPDLFPVAPNPFTQPVPAAPAVNPFSQPVPATNPPTQPVPGTTQTKPQTAEVESPWWQKWLPAPGVLVIIACIAGVKQCNKTTPKPENQQPVQQYNVPQQGYPPQQYIVPDRRRYYGN